MTGATELRENYWLERNGKKIALMYEGRDLDPKAEAQKIVDKLNEECRDAYPL